MNDWLISQGPPHPCGRHIDHLRLPFNKRRTAQLQGVILADSLQLLACLEFASALQSRTHNLPWVSVGRWFQDPCSHILEGYQNLRTFKSLTVDLPSPRVPHLQIQPPMDRVVFSTRCRTPPTILFQRSLIGSAETLSSQLHNVRTAPDQSCSHSFLYTGATL